MTATCDAPHPDAAYRRTPPTWLHVVHYTLDPWSVPEDEHGHPLPQHLVTVRRYCSVHATQAMALDASDTQVTLATYKPL